MESFNYPPPPQPPPAPQIQYVTVAAEPGRGLAITALVFGIVGSVFGLIPITSLVALAGGLVAVVLGVIAWRKRGRVHLKRTMAAWAVALGVLALILGSIGFYIVQDSVNDLDRDLNELDNGPQFGIQDAGDVDGDGWDECIMAAVTDAEHEACYAAGSSRSTDSSGWVGP